MISTPLGLVQLTSQGNEEPSLLKATGSKDQHAEWRLS